MRKLLRANVSRLLRDRAFWLLAALMAALGASMAVVNAVHARQDGEIWTMDYTLFIYVILAPILASVFTALFVGNEHSSGAMRNKLIAGHGAAASILQICWSAAARGSVCAWPSRCRRRASGCC